MTSFPDIWAGSGLAGPKLPSCQPHANNACPVTVGAMSPETIYVALVNEGTTAWRPVEAEQSADGTFCILSETPEEEEWAFKSGQKVVVKHHVFADGTRGLVADREAG
jgi:hypothetical protein